MISKLLNPMTVFSPHLSIGFETVYYSFILAVLPCFSSLDIIPFVCLISQWLFHLCLFCGVSQASPTSEAESFDFFFPICIESLGDNILHSGFKCHLYADGSQLYAVLVSSTSLNSRTASPTTQMDMNVSRTSQICCVLD